MSARNIDVVCTNSIEECRRLVKKGYEPIAVRLKDGRKTVVIRGKKNLVGSGSELLRHALGLQPDPKLKFVTSSKPVVEVTLSIAHLLGLVPNDGLLLRIIDHLEGKESTETIGIFTLHNLLFGTRYGELSMIAGIAFWRTIVHNYQIAVYRNLIEAAATAELQRRDEAERALKEGQLTGPLQFVETPIWGFDVWHKVAPVVIMYNPETGKILVSAKDQERKYFPSGVGRFLRENFGEGWGGTANLGGSPADEAQSKEDLAKVLETIRLYLGA